MSLEPSRSILSLASYRSLVYWLRPILLPRPPGLPPALRAAAPLEGCGVSALPFPELWCVSLEGEMVGVGGGESVCL